MTCKEAFKELKENAQEICEWELVRLNIIEKDLEVLEILKKHYNKDSVIKSLNSFISFHIYKDDKDFNKVQEWLEDEN